MSNCSFKNALISGKPSLDASWPCLSDTNQIKRPNRNNTKSLSLHTVEEHSDPIISLNETQGCSSFDLPTDQRTNAPDRAQSGKLLQKEEFPELLDSSYRKKQNSFCLNHSNSLRIETLSGVTKKSGFKYSSKHPKFKNGIVDVPLLSFVKAPSVKRKNLVKKSNLLHNSLCGNKLDRDQPVRKKGKVRIHKKKYESRIKKEIIISRRVKKRRIVYNQNILKAKCLIPSLVNCSGGLDVNKLESLLNSLNIEEKVDKTVPVSSNEARIEDKIAREIAKSILHSQAFRLYCTNVVNSSLLKSVESLIVALRNFQDRLHAKEPVKAFAKRRYVCGFKESKKFLLAGKLKLIVVATNLQLDEDLPSGRILREIRSLAEENNVPLVFAGRGNQIGYWTLKRRRISIVSVLNYEGAEEIFRNVIKNWEECKNTYKSLLDEIELHLSREELSGEALPKNIEEEIRENILSKFFEEAEVAHCDVENSGEAF